MLNNQPIGIFDSGYGGLTVFRSILELLPEYDYVYLGDNSRAPYGNRSFSSIHQYTWESVQALFKMGCPLVILACNTASAKALRTIQQKDLPEIGSQSLVSKILNGERKLTVSHINHLAKRFGVSPLVFMTEKKKGSSLDS